MVGVTDIDRGWTKLFKRVSEIKDSKIRVGVLGDAKEDSGISVQEIAAIQEFGTEDGTIPARSFIRSTFDRERLKLGDMGRTLMTQVLDGRISVHAALDVMGAYLSSAMKRTITDGIAPANAQSTLIAKAKKSRKFKPSARNIGQAFSTVGILAAVKPLIESGRMLNAISWSIISTGEE